jgi:outer membrane protein assembly factor BamB
MEITARIFVSQVARALVGLVVCQMALAGPLTHAADWPQFLGPTREGKASATENFALGEGVLFVPKVLWTHPLGSGFAGPVVVDGKAIIFHRVGDKTLVEAIGARDGTDIWRFSYENAYKDNFGMDDGPRGCPAVSQGKVIVHGAEGMVHALNLADGALLWKYDTVKETGSPQGFFGRACSPLVIDDRVILTPGGRLPKGPAGMVALNLADGKLLWNAVEDEAGYASPALHGGLVFCWMRNNFVAVSALDGKIILQKPLRSEMDASVNAAQQVWLEDERVFTTAGYGVGADLWKWDRASARLTRVWHKDDALECHYSTPVYHRGYLFGFHGRQEFGQHLRCVRAEDGKVMWESGRVPGGTLLLVQDTLLVLTEAGELWVVDASPEKFNRKAQEQILRGGHRSYAAYSNGVLYARDDRQLVAVDLMGK